MFYLTNFNVYLLNKKFWYAWRNSIIRKKNYQPFHMEYWLRYIEKKYPDSNMQNYYNHVKCKIGNALRIMTGMEKNIAPKTIFYWISINSLIVVIQYFLMQKTTPNFKIGKKKMNFVLPSLIHYSKTYLGH